MLPAQLSPVLRCPTPRFSTRHLFTCAAARLPPAVAAPGSCFLPASSSKQARIQLSAPQDGEKTTRRHVAGARRACSTATWPGTPALPTAEGFWGGSVAPRSPHALLHPTSPAVLAPRTPSRCASFAPAQPHNIPRETWQRMVYWHLRIVPATGEPARPGQGWEQGSCPPCGCGELFPQVLALLPEVHQPCHRPALRCWSRLAGPCLEKGSEPRRSIPVPGPRASSGALHCPHRQEHGSSVLVPIPMPHRSPELGTPRRSSRFLSLTAVPVQDTEHGSPAGRGSAPGAQVAGAGATQLCRGAGAVAWVRSWRSRWVLRLKLLPHWVQM